jgi:hypothetical protein
MRKQQLAQNRNWFKFLVSGLSKPVNRECLSGLEQCQWDKILAIRKDILVGFDDTSRNRGLNVRVKEESNY